MWGTHLGTDCRSWSQARDNGKNGWSGPLRSDSCVLGLPNLLAADRLKVELGNTFMISSFAVLTLCHKLRLLATMEKTSRSRIWLTAQFAALSGLPSFVNATTHYCQFGMRWRKETHIVGVHISLLSISRKCSSKRISL